MEKKYFRTFKIIAFLIAAIYCNTAVAQSNSTNSANTNMGEVHGNFQMDAQYYTPDSTIGAAPAPEKVLMNAFANVIYTKGNFTAGFRYESYLNARQGFDSRYQGNGILYRFATYKADFLEITAGSFYQQFGNGFVLRSYEDFGLGFDNALDGVRLNEAFKQLADKKLIVTLGGSFVSRYQQDQNPTLVLPENVGASAGRFNISRNNFSINGEYAYKINDPNAANNYIYKPGEAILLATNYAIKGFAASLKASRTDNMNFRSDREASGNNLLINYTPALNMQHTYSLLTFYPYASQPNGEYQFSGEVDKSIIKTSDYKLDVTVNYSGAYDLDTVQLNPAADSTLQGYKTKSYGLGKNVLFRDFYLEVNQKFGKKFKMSAVYSYQEYNNKSRITTSYNKTRQTKLGIRFS